MLDNGIGSEPDRGSGRGCGNRFGSVSENESGRAVIRDLGTGRRLSDVFETLASLPMAVFLDSSLNVGTASVTDDAAAVRGGGIVGGADGTSGDGSRAAGGAGNAEAGCSAMMGRFSIVAVNPYLSLEETEGACTRIEFEGWSTYESLDVAADERGAGTRAGGTSGGDDDAGECETAVTAPQRPRASISTRTFEDELRVEMARISSPNNTGLPLVDGAIGYLSYDYGRKFESIATRHPRTTVAPDARMTFYDDLLVEDHSTGHLYAISHGVLREAETALDELSYIVARASRRPAPAKASKLADFAPNFAKDEYKQALSQMIDYIVAGDIYIANMTQRLDICSSAKPFDVYRYMRVHNPAPFSAYLNYPESQVACASMERFLQVRDGMVETRPIKGTRPRGRTPEEDQAMREELAASSKDRSELLMIVDLERNDLNCVCEPGSVKVTDHFAVEAYATVFHLVSTVQGRLREGAGVLDLLRAAFPGGSITGAPKIRAMQIIDELEHGRRGLYTGSIGYLSADGGCDFNIVIRTAVHEDGRYSIGAGGGITCESDLEFEYEETLQKARAVLEAIEAGGK